MATQNTGFTLVQGPPGTGKTTTVIGLLNSIHLKEYTVYYDSLLSAALGQEGERCRQAISASDLEGRWIQLVTTYARSKVSTETIFSASTF